MAINLQDQVLDRATCIRMLLPGTPTDKDTADFVSQDADGFTVNWTLVSGTAKEVIYLSFGPRVTVWIQGGTILGGAIK